ncbi:MAG: alpha-hydroxy-acid oxidizing protein [Oscillospiraceae bacterium]|jgi:isopentenyl diphosphate isomerase/L-lactate dehydrogenase-like FMN-dependent dehydrogenase|nr:alpha-hydroxy-acid oxidizing protein [Oscillospiraceae bacterium]
MAEMKRPGDSNRITREYFETLRLELRHIDSILPSTAFTLYGETFATPVTTAALSHLNGVHPGGMVELARGAQQAGAVMFCGMGDESELDGILATGARTIKIIKPYTDEGLIEQKMEHAEAKGAMALGMDLDHAFGHAGGYDHVLGYDMRPKTLAQIKGYVRRTRLPFIIKGVLSETDALKCMDAGVQGIVVSHHHGIVDDALPPLRILPRIAKAIGGAMPIFVDCGFESGMDVFKALALGATGVSIGRALMGPLGEGGAEAARRTIEKITASLAHLMAVTGAHDLKSIDPDVIWDEHKR